MSRELEIGARVLAYRETHDPAVVLRAEHRVAVEWYQDGGALADLSYLLARVAEFEGQAEAKRADLVVTLRERYEEGGDKSYRLGFEDGIGVAADLVERGGP